MSLRKSLKRIGSKVQEKAKDVGRQVQSVAAKAVVPVTAVLSTVGTFIGGPVLGEAFALPGSALARGLGATAARKQGIKGMEARTEGRELMQRTFKYSQLGVGLGMGGAALTGALGGVMGGGGVIGGLTGGVGNIFGIGGGGGGYSSLPESYSAEGLAGGASGEPTYLPPGAGTGQYTGAYPTGTSSAWGTVANTALGVAGTLGKAYLTPQQQQAAQQGGGGGFFENLFNTTPGSGVDLPVVGEVPTGVLILGGVAVLALTAK